MTDEEKRNKLFDEVQQVIYKLLITLAYTREGWGGIDPFNHIGGTVSKILRITTIDDKQDGT